MRKKKAFTKTTGHYFFDVGTGFNNITISRVTRAEAVYAFTNYVKQKKECEWFGQWDGKKFIDTDIKKAA